MTGGIYFEKFLFVLAGAVWGLYLFGAPVWVIAAVAATIFGGAIIERVTSRRKQLRVSTAVDRRLL